MKEQHSGWNILLGLFVFMSVICFSGCGKKEEMQFFSAEETDDSQVPSTFPEEEKEPVTIFVDVGGAVKNPGVYELQEGSRVFEAIEAAGGFSLDAHHDNVNLASILQDAQRIFIPSEDDLGNAEETAVQPEVLADQTNGDIDTKIDINEADLEKFMTLTGIGETRAKAIVQYREEHGAFSSIEEIMNVQGIKDGTFAKIKDEIVVR